MSLPFDKEAIYKRLCLVDEYHLQHYYYFRVKYFPNIYCLLICNLILYSFTNIDDLDDYRQSLIIAVKNGQSSAYQFSSFSFRIGFQLV